MNYIKAQESIFRALVKGERVYRFDVDADRTFITPDGFRGFIFPNDILWVKFDDPISHVVVTENVRGNIKPVGVVLPVRINEGRNEA